MDRESLFLNKFCKLELRKNNFVLRGYVREVDTYGVLFETDQATSFINWDQIYELVPIQGDR